MRASTHPYDAGRLLKSTKKLNTPRHENFNYNLTPPSTCNEFLTPFSTFNAQKLCSYTKNFKNSQKTELVAELNVSDENQICPVIHMDGDKLSYVTVKFGPELSEKALVDTGACANALPQEIYQKLSKNSSNGPPTLKTQDFTKYDLRLEKL